jgi:hypothetical protein
MNRSRVDPTLKVPRYLAGQLSPEEAHAFEEAYIRDPEIVADLDRTLRLKAGLAVLRDRGDLTALLQEDPQPRRRWLIGAAAATLVAAVVGISFWRQPWLTESSHAARVLAVSHPSMPVVGHYVLIRRRGVPGEISLPHPSGRGLIEFTIVPSVFAPQERYAAQLARLDASGKVPIDSIDSVSPSENREVRIYLDSGRLQRGDYELSLMPVSAPAETDSFVLHLK